MPQCLHVCLSLLMHKAEAADDMLVEWTCLTLQHSAQLVSLVAGT